MSRKAERVKNKFYDDIARQEYSDGAIKKKFSIQDLKTIRPMTCNQEEVFHSAANDMNILAIGSPGTGKTFLLMYLGLRNVLEPSTPYNRLVIVRSVAVTRSYGFLPGEEEDKLAPFEAPYKDICNSLFPYSKSYDNLKKSGYIEFESTSHLRGRTFSNCILLLDECQNLNEQELYTVLSRVGHNCTVYMAGDTRQSDLHGRNDKSALQDWIPLLSRISSMDKVVFNHHDIVRSGFVKELVILKDEMGL